MKKILYFLILCHFVFANNIKLVGDLSIKYEKDNWNYVDTKILKQKTKILVHRKIEGLTGFFDHSVMGETKPKIKPYFINECKKHEKLSGTKVTISKKTMSCEIEKTVNGKISYQILFEKQIKDRKKNISVLHFAQFNFSEENKAKSINAVSKLLGEIL